MTDLAQTQIRHATPTPALSYGPLTLPAPGRLTPLEVQVSAPATGDHLPVLLLSHGHGPSNHLSSRHGYGPLASWYAARGFVVVQPTHLDAKMLPYRASDHADAPLFWRSRAEDMSRILDALDVVEGAVPGLAGRVDRGRVGVVGHSMGGHTASVLLGARHVGEDGAAVSVADPRIRAGVILAGPGRGDALSAYAAAHYPFFRTIDFGTMTTPALVVAGDDDPSPHLTTAGSAWHADPYALAPAPKALLTVFGAGHGLGGVSGWDAAETTDEDPARVAFVARMSWAFLRSALDPADRAWDEARREVEGSGLGRVETK
ncbi:MAG: chlorophyllase [Deltaproteobacteria bacterium]|nr:chlorophyllase [Deltaproteobacteria bacterium]